MDFLFSFLPTSRQKEEAFRIASVTFLEYLESRFEPDENMYREYIVLHNNLLVGEGAEKKKILFLGSLMLNAPPKIQQSRNVLASLRAALPWSLYEELVENFSTS